MSHAANLRKYRPPHSDVPTKRRRLSPSSTALPKPNGVPDLTATKLSAVPTRDLKAREKIRHDQSKVNVREAESNNDLDTSSDSSSNNDDTDDSTGSDSSDDDDDDDASENDEQEEAQNSEEAQLRPDGEEATQENHVLGDHTTSGAPEPHSDEEPSFGDLLRARAPETITVEAAAAEPAEAGSNLVGPPAKGTLSVPSANSLGTVLTQALKTNDADLLESCLHTPNLESIRATIERIHPAQATALLQRLAERLHRRPGRAGSLMVWVQWTVVAHGGYIASKPAAMKELRTLYQVVKQRACGLQPLLALKGKLDMLEAQMQLRRNMQAWSKGARRGEEEEGIIYVEGQEDENNNEDENDQMGDARTGKQPKRHQGKGKDTSKPSLTIASDDESDGERLPITLPNGVDGSDAEDDEGKDEAEYDSDEEEDDDEVEDADADSDALSDEIDYDDVDGAEDMGSGSESNEEERDEPPSKRQKHKDTEASSSKRR